MSTTERPPTRPNRPVATAMQRLASLRDRLGVTREDVGERLGLTIVAVTRLEASVDPLASTIDRYTAGLAAAAGRDIATDLTITVDRQPADAPLRHLRATSQPGGDRAVRIRAWNDPDLELRFVSENFVALGGAEIGDLTHTSDRETLTALLVQALPGRDAQAIQLFCTYWERFVSYLRIGDVVALPASKAKTVSIGEITGPYQYVADERDPRARHRRSVRWLSVGADRTTIDTDLIRAINAPGTIGALKAPDAAGRLRAHASK